MSVQVFESEQHHGANSAGEFAAQTREWVELIEAHTPVTIYYVEADGEEEYAAVLHIGGDRYARVSYKYTGESYPHLITITAGYLSAGSYVAVQSQQWAVRGFTREYVNVVHVLNGGDAWDACIFLAASGLGYALFRCFRLISSIDNHAEYITGIHNNTAWTAQFPGAGDLFIANDTTYAVRLANAVNYSTCIPPGKIMLFPQLVYISDAEIDLGTPTLGGKPMYVLMGDPTPSLNYGTEFVINNQRYISLGSISAANVAIRSE